MSRWILVACLATLLTPHAGANGLAPGTSAPRRQRKQRKTVRSGGPQPRPHGPIAELGFVDAHVHLNDVDMALTVMRENNIDRAVVFWGRDSTNDSLAAAAELHPGAFIPFFSISPERRAYRRAWVAEDTAILEEVDAALGTGRFRGIGELSVTHFPGHGFPEASFGPLHPLTIAVFELAAKHHVPVNIHCEITDIDPFSELLRRFEAVTVIWAHGGYTPYFLARRMLDQHPNLVYELSARTWRHHPRSPEYTIYRDGDAVWPRWLELIESRPERFVVGTDAALHSPTRARGKVTGVQRLLEQLTPATRKQVARDNILAITGVH